MNSYMQAYIKDCYLYNYYSKTFLLHMFHNFCEGLQETSQLKSTFIMYPLMKISFLNSLATSAKWHYSRYIFSWLHIIGSQKLQILLFCDRTTYSVMVNFKQLPIHSTTIVQYSSTVHTGLWILAPKCHPKPAWYTLCDT